MLNTAKLMIYEVILLLAKIKLRKQSTDNDTILLIKTDELGDYILFRNYITLIAATYGSGKKIIFVGNQMWKNLFDNFDRHPSIIATYWVDKGLFKSKMLYRYQLLKQISHLNAGTAINMVYSRTRRHEDAIVSVAAAPLKIAYTGNTDNALPIEKPFNKNLYAQLINVPDKLHDFLKHRLFLQQLKGQEIKVPELEIPRVSNNSFSLPEKPYVLIFPGSGKPEKIWTTDKFIDVANFITKTLGFNICLCGSKADVPHAINFITNFTGDVTDYCGKTNMIQVIELIQKSQFTVSIDTGSVHLSAACNVPAFAVYNGIHYGRFAPYPAELRKNIYPIYPDEVEKQLLRNMTDEIIVGDYNDVTAEKLIKAIKLFKQLS
ncbi:glycosyltransferase family 9 protein [Ferruginibacter sp. SUN106]|uniref:glycosyltransferase family 9 protein n=1 Tax=Ferruginibacter sp. SUN106 TaxID=2978348 RepID=UPI003D360C92